MTLTQPARRWHLGKTSLALGLVIGGVAVLFGATRVMGVPARSAPAVAVVPPVASLLSQLAEPEFAPASEAIRDADSPPPAPDLSRAAPEQRLVAVYRAIAASQMDSALRMTEALLQDRPNFRLAQLLHGDLLALRGGGEPGAGLDGLSGEARADLLQLREEARLRIVALRERPPADAVPSQFVMLPASVKHAIAVDVARARLYLFANDDKGLHLLGDYYVSVGKQGADKLVEGDQKTPLGIYHTTESIDPKLLEDRFGAGALPLNYPNAWDRIAGRTGSGILLHGVPSDTYARVPRATDGCVVLANDDLLHLAATIAPRNTPVVIAQKLDWVPQDRARASGSAFLQRLQAWQAARIADDRQTLVGFYDPAAEANAAAASASAASAAPLSPARARGSRKAVARTPSPLVGFDDVSVLAWSDRQPLMVVSYRERLADSERPRRVKRQYWALESGTWRIVSES